jgi:hypothetical protein
MPTKEKYVKFAHSNGNAIKMAIFKREQVTCEIFIFKREEVKLSPRNKRILKQNLGDGSCINTTREADFMIFLTQRFLLQLLF